MVAVYVPACVTFNVASVSPIISTPLRNQVYELPPVAVRTVDPPVQIEAVAGEMEPDGEGDTVTTELFDVVPLQSPW